MGNLRYGELGSTVSSAKAMPIQVHTPVESTVPSAPVPKSPPSPKTGTCCYGGCNGDCKSPQDWCSQSASNCEEQCNGKYCDMPVMNRVKQNRLLRGRDHLMVQRIHQFIKGKSVSKKLSATRDNREL